MNQLNKKFKLFSLIFSPPTKETLEEIKKLGLEGLSEESRRILLETDQQELLIEYTRTFINAYPKVPCPPYESYYREGVVYGEASVQVEKIYRNHGLIYDYKSEPPDHISVELEFLAIEEDIEFLERVKKWVPLFTKCVKENSKIYASLAIDLEKFIKSL